MFNTDVGILLQWIRRINIIFLCASSIIISGLVYSDPVPVPGLNQDQPVLANPDDVIKIPLSSPQPLGSAAISVPPNAVGADAPVESAAIPVTNIHANNGLISFY